MRNSMKRKKRKTISIAFLTLFFAFCCTESSLCFAEEEFQDRDSLSRCFEHKWLIYLGFLSNESLLIITQSRRNHYSIVHICDVEDERELYRFQVEGSRFLLSPDGSLLLTIRILDEDEKIVRIIYEVQSGRELYRLEHDEKYGHFSRFSLDGSLLITGNGLFSTYIYEAINGTELTHFKNEDETWPHNISPDGSLIAIFKEPDKAIHIHQISNGQRLHSFPVDLELFELHFGLFDFIFSPDSSLLAIKTLDSSPTPDLSPAIFNSINLPIVSVYDVESGERLYYFKSGMDVGNIFFSPDGSLILVQWLDINLIEPVAGFLELSVYNVKSGQKLIHFTAGKIEDFFFDHRFMRGGPSFFFSPDSSYFALATRERDATVFLYETENGRVHTLKYENRVSKMAFSQDGSLFAVGLKGGSLPLFSTEDKFKTVHLYRIRTPY